MNLKKRHKSPGRCAKKSIHKLYSSQQPAWSVAKSTRTSFAVFFVAQNVNLYKNDIICWCNLEMRLQGHAHRYHRDKDTSRSGPDCAFQWSTHLAHTSAVPGAPPSEVNLKTRHKSPGRCAKNSIHKLYSSQQPAWSVAKCTRSSAVFFVVQIVNFYMCCNFEAQGYRVMRISSS